MLAEFPEWRAHSREEEYNGECYFVVELAAPLLSDLADPLRIDTHNDEVTVSLDYYHSHFDYFGEGEAHEDALHFIRDVLEERTGIVSWWAGEKWRGSSVLRAGEMLEPAEHMAGSTRVRVRSWHGRLNRDIDV